MAWLNMADDANESNRNRSPKDDEAALTARLRRLGEGLNRLDAKKPGTPDRGPPSSGDPSALARGFRMSTELVAGVIVGVGLGLLLDRWLGTTPWGLLVFLLLGFTAGILNLMRSVGLSQRPEVRPPQDKHDT